MAIKPVLRMGDPRLLQPSQPVETFDTPELHSLVQDLLDTMVANNGAGIAAPQIGVNLQVVIFGSSVAKVNPRYPDAEHVPYTVLINPVLSVLGDDVEDGWEGCLSVPGLRGLVPRAQNLRYQGCDQFGNVIDRSVGGLPCPRGATRVRPPLGYAIPNAHQGFEPVRVCRCAVP